MPRYWNEKKRTDLKCRPRRVIPHCFGVCNEFAYVLECGRSRFSAVLLAMSQFIYAPGINVSYVVSAAAPQKTRTVCLTAFNALSLVKQWKPLLPSFKVQALVLYALPFVL